MVATAVVCKKKRDDLKTKRNSLSRLHGVPEREGRASATANALQKRKLGAEEDGFALEHFDGDEESSARVDAV